MDNKNKRSKPTDYKVGDRVLVLAGQYKDKIGTVQAHYDANLILEFKPEDRPPFMDNVHYAEVIKWFDFS